MEFKEQMKFYGKCSKKLDCKPTKGLNLASPIN